ncbi:hypothetical protein LC607_00190 [Nostoc sp. CHAB 5824]|nr:hypothetical protein [Nostoc sp. CHAB 5824]
MNRREERRDESRLYDQKNDRIAILFTISVLPGAIAASTFPLESRM